MLTGTLSPLAALWTREVGGERTAPITTECRIIAFVPQLLRVGEIEKSSIVAVVAEPGGKLKVAELDGLKLDQPKK